MPPTRQYLAFTWLDPRQKIRLSPIHGKGVFAREAIKQGEVAEISGGLVKSVVSLDLEWLHLARPSAATVVLGTLGTRLKPWPDGVASRNGWAAFRSSGSL